MFSNEKEKMTKFISKVEEIYVFRKDVFKLDYEILRD